MKKLILLGVTTLLLGACGGDKSSNEITVWTHNSPEHPEGRMIEKRVEEYNEANKDKLQIKLQNFTRAGAGSGYMDKLNASITAGDMPDIFTLDGPDLASYVDAGVVREFNSLIDADYLNGFTTAIKEQGTIDGKMYSIGYQDSGVIVTYNKKILELLPESLKELLPKSPTEDWSWNDFYQVAMGLKALKENPQTKDLDIIKNMELPVSFGIGDLSKGGYEIAMYYLAPVIWSNNSNVVSPDGLNVKNYLDNQKTLESLAMLGKFFSSDLASLIEPDKAFHNEKAAMALAGFWYVSDLQANYPDLEYGAFKYPKMDETYLGNYTPSGSWSFVMSSKLKDDEAKTKEVAEVLKWLTNNDSVELYYNEIGSIPVRQEKLDIIKLDTDDKSYNEAWTALKNQAEKTNKARPVSPVYPYISETFAKDVILKLAREKADTKEEIKVYVDTAIEKMERELQKYRK